jgi:hypothetical protein
MLVDWGEARNAGVCHKVRPNMVTELPYHAGSMPPGTGGVLSGGARMPNMRRASHAVALIAVGLTVALAACTSSEVKPNLTIVQEKPAAGGSEASVSREAAAEICAEKTRKKGIKSVTAIFSRLRPGKADEDFAACMREQGFAVGGVSEAGGAPVAVTE